ncbi:MAG: hypothetical protein ABIP81_05575 [Terriglobales bacterium]
MSSFPTQLPTEIVGTLKVCPEIAFADHKGKRKSGIEKTSRKLLTLLQSPLEKFLDADEIVLSVFRAQSHVSAFRQYTMGIFVYGLTATVVVVTDQRLLQLRTNSWNRWDHGVRSCKWETVAKALVKGILGKELTLHFLEAKKHRVWKLPGAQAKVLKKLLPELIQAKHQGRATPGGIHPLCPECKGALTPANYECPSCKLLFKNEQKMRWLALLPGAAYFYCGKPILGVMDFLGEGITLLVFIIVTMGALLSTDTNPLDWSGLGVTFGFILFILAIDIAVTIHHCQHFVRDFIPTKEYAQTKEQAFSASAGFKT